MSLYDDEDDIIDKAKDTKVAAGWSQGIKLMQSQLQLKKTNKTPKGRDIPRSKTAVLAPVMDLKKSVSKGNGKANDDIFESKYAFTADKPFQSFRSSDNSLIPLDPNVKLEREYDPLWPNDYEKVVKEMRDKKRSDNGVDSRSEEREDSPPEKKRRYLVNNRDKARERFNASDQGASFVGFGGRPASPEDDERPGLDSRPRRNPGSGGAAIAPPPSLTESSVSPPPDPTAAKPTKQTGLGIAAKIMAKYGYKEGGGLGKSEQGMAKALVVEKTSKRGGRILKGDEIEETPPPTPGGAAIPPPACLDSSTTPPAGVVSDYSGGVVSEYGGEDDDIRPPSEFDGSPIPPPEAEPEKPKPSITDMMKNPSKVVLCKNMVGPGEVDEELEPEVMDECGGKYGDVNKVTIVEVPDVSPEEAVRIFIEFKRVESAIKALVDLNGRFFGGREVQAVFYDLDKFLNNQLNE